ncbi:hypothetical protein ACOYR4_11330 [Acidovorax sp. M14]|uniref:hypothetical protein n=1 Tax=Acidovorax sp. M14 TaxID=3411354 RepID=UPI003BF4BF11
MATTIKTAPGEQVTVAPTLIPVLGGVPEARVQLILRRGPIVIDRKLSPADAYSLGMALCAAAGDAAP